MHPTISQLAMKAALAEACRLMPAGFDPDALAQNDRFHDWEFKPVLGLQSKAGVQGLYTREWPLVTVLWDSSLSEEEQQLTIAHEIGHHFLHSLTGRPGNEDEADEFAKALLRG